jgi:hypothetical protein
MYIPMSDKSQHSVATNVCLTYIRSNILISPNKPASNMLVVNKLLWLIIHIPRYIVFIIKL